MIQTSSALRKIISRSLTLLALISALLLPAYASDELSLSDARAPKGEYTATLEEMAVKRLYAYGFLDAPTEDATQEQPDGDTAEYEKDCTLPMRTDGNPDRLDAALMLYRACGVQPKNPCPLFDVPEDYADAVAWLYESGATRGIGNRMYYGTGEVTEAQFSVMLSRLLQWETEDLGIIEYVMQERGLAPLNSVDGAFTFGEMYQIVCNLLDHAYPERCIPQNGKELTPKTIELHADSCEDAMRKLRKASLYLPQKIDVSFVAECPKEEIERFQSYLTWDGGRKTMPLLQLTNPRYNLPFHLETAEDDCCVTVYSYSQAAEAAACVTNWLQVFRDEKYCEELRCFYLERVFPLKRLDEYGRVIQCHDTICRLASYDYTEYDKQTKSGTGLRLKAHDLVGFMENRHVVCDGYANVYSWMLMELGVDSYIVHGGTNGGRHAWNKVCLNGNWYNVDVCWNDTGFFLRRYFLKSDAWMMEHVHSFTDAFSTTVYQSSENYEQRGSVAA